MVTGAWFAQRYMHREGLVKTDADVQTTRDFADVDILKVGELIPAFPGNTI